ncbi:hypothetical protein TNCV_4411311 [Trichonephila clavipes]|nr:hypothetical protein TNCV_4411311 [Trichonephila clavipes]
MHSSISEGARTPTKKNSFLELYQMTSYDLAKKKRRIAEKGTPFGDPKKKRNFASKWIKEGISFANVVSCEVPNQIPIDDKRRFPMDSLVKIVTLPQT